MLKKKVGCWPPLCAATAVAVLVSCLAIQAAAATDNSSLPQDLELKPLIEQLLARKAFLREHMRSEEWAK
jgi:hypothetical protein